MSAVFYDNYLSLCLEKNVSRTRACTDCGVSRTAWRKWEAGGIPNGATLNLLAEYFNVSVSDLLGEATSPKRFPPESPAPMPQFSARLKFLRTKLGLSQAELARMVGSTKSSINMYERGEREPGIEMLKVLASFFHVDMNYLLGESGPQTGPEMIRRKISARDISPAQLFEWPDNGSLKAGDSAMNEMYNRIEILCRQNGINITTMCRESGVPRGNLTDLKKGRSKELSTKNLVRLSSYFNVPLDYFVGNTPASSFGCRKKCDGSSVRDAIANNLRRAREDAGLTQAGAAEAIGITPQAVRNYERGISGIDVETLLALCAVYKVRLESVIPVDAISQEQNRKEATNEQTSNL